MTRADRPAAWESDSWALRSSRPLGSSGPRGRRSPAAATAPRRRSRPSSRRRRAGARRRRPGTRRRGGCRRRRRSAAAVGGALLALERVAEHDVPVPQLFRLGRQLLDGEDDRVLGGVDPAAGLGDGAVGVRLGGPDAVRRLLDVTSTPRARRVAASVGVIAARCSVSRASARSHKWVMSPLSARRARPPWRSAAPGRRDGPPAGGRPRRGRGRRSRVSAATVGPEPEHERGERTGRARGVERVGQGGGEGQGRRVRGRCRVRPPPPPGRRRPGPRPRASSRLGSRRAAATPRCRSSRRTRPGWPARSAAGSSTQCSGGCAGSGRSCSPRPVPIADPAERGRRRRRCPSRAASRCRSPRCARDPTAALQATRAAAASAEPPARPPATGIALAIVSSTAAGRPAAGREPGPPARRGCCSSAGTPRGRPCRRTRSSSAGRAVSSSKRSTAWKTVMSSWKPSGRARRPAAAGSPWPGPDRDRFDCPHEGRG